MQRIMAIDYGDSRTGIAVSDMMQMLCGEVWTIDEWNPEKLSISISESAKIRDVGTLVLGLPKNMDGTEGPRAEKSRAFKEMLERDSGLPVVMWDERLTTVQAHSILHAAGKREKAYRDRIDGVAASLILEGYLGSIR